MQTCLVVAVAPANSLELRWPPRSASPNRSCINAPVGRCISGNLRYSRVISASPLLHQGPVGREAVLAAQLVEQHRPPEQAQHLLSADRAAVVAVEERGRRGEGRAAQARQPLARDEVGRSAAHLLPRALEPRVLAQRRSRRQRRHLLQARAGCVQRRELLLVRRIHAGALKPRQHSHHSLDRRRLRGVVVLAVPLQVKRHRGQARALGGGGGHCRRGSGGRSLCGEPCLLGRAGKDGGGRRRRCTTGRLRRREAAVLHSGEEEVVVVAPAVADRQPSLLLESVDLVEEGVLVRWLDQVVEPLHADSGLARLAKLPLCGEDGSQRTCRCRNRDWRAE
mmetsp:Transcript_36308/g.120208  ORF Transcript_36308/g.120208 Transcript_36308/m.120208 type:complete len:337 (-) Transcript_36308:83-1093(-)